MDPLLIVIVIVVGLLVLLTLFYGRLRRRQENQADGLPTMAAPPQSRPALIAIRPSTYNNYPFAIKNSGVTFIGRSSRNDIQVFGQSASREHAAIINSDDGSFIRDLNPNNPSQVNGRPLEGEHILREGDRIVIGETELVFVHDYTAVFGPDSPPRSQPMDSTSAILPSRAAGSPPVSTSDRDDQKMQARPILVIEDSEDVSVLTNFAVDQRGVDISATSLDKSEETNFGGEGFCERHGPYDPSHTTCPYCAMENQRSQPVASAPSPSDAKEAPKTEGHQSAENFRGGGFCERHGPYDPPHTNCPYCAMENQRPGGAGHFPPPDYDEAETNIGPERESFMFSDDDITEEFDIVPQPVGESASLEPEPPPPPAPEPKRRERSVPETEEEYTGSRDGLMRGVVDAPEAPKTEIHQSAEDAEQVTQIGVVEGDVNITYESPKADTQFAAYYPEQVAPDEWQPLFTYIYKDLALKHVQDDVLEQQRQHDDVKLDSEFKPAKVAVPQGARITAALDLPGFEIETPEPITFFKDWHRLDFRIRAVSAPHNAPVMGHLTFHSDHDGLPLLVAEIFFEVLVGEAVAAGVSEAVVNMFSFIYCSLSDVDLPVYERLKAAYDLMDIQYLRSEGVQQREVLLALLSGADKFHLLWSNAAAESAQVQQELRLAFELAQQRAHFIRPVYWEQPRPPVPPELADIAFDYKPQLAG